MFHCLGIILDFSFIQNDNTRLFNGDQNMFEICSVFIKIYNHENPTSQMMILALNNQNLQQITHLSGDIKHHYQGLWYLLFQKKRHANYDQGFFFNERIDICGYKKAKYELLFISEGALGFLDSNFFSIFMGRKKRKFSVISLNIKAFALQILTKITGGKYITLFNKRIRILSAHILQNFKKPFFSGNIYSLIFSFSVNRFILRNLQSKTTTRITNGNIVKICQNCKNKDFWGPQIWCQNCGVYMIRAFDCSDIVKYSKKNNKFTSYYNFVFSLFGPILNKKGVSGNLFNKKIFNFFNLKNKINYKKITNGYNLNTISNNHNEILMTGC